MSYDINNLVKLAALKALAEKISANYAAKADLNILSSRLDDLNIPTKVSQLTNDEKYQTDSEVSAQIASAISTIDCGTF